MRTDAPPYLRSIVDDAETSNRRVLQFKPDRPCGLERS